MQTKFKVHSNDLSVYNMYMPASQKPMHWHHWYTCDMSAQ